jgi:hypothetical protein
VEKLLGKKTKRSNKILDNSVNLPNCVSQQFNIKGGLHVLIYTSEEILAGETLYYDYNLGGLNEVDTNQYD